MLLTPEQKWRNAVPAFAPNYMTVIHTVFKWTENTLYSEANLYSAGMDTGGHLRKE